MIKQILVLSFAALLVACSGSSSSRNTNGDTFNDGAEDKLSRAGAYIGDFGSGHGVYVLSESDALSGLALSDDGSAHSLFGLLSAESTFVGSLRSYAHSPSQPFEQGVFGAGDSDKNSENPAATAFNLNIVEGQTIESLSGNPVNLVAAAAGDLTASSPTEIAGNWSGEHRICNDAMDLINNCSLLKTEITFEGDTVNGRTVVISPDGSEPFSDFIEGNIAKLGNLSTLSFTWNDLSYTGSVFFLPGNSTQLVFLGETSTVDTNRPTIATLLTREDS